jgi:hypothetical protein
MADFPLNAPLFARLAKQRSGEMEQEQRYRDRKALERRLAQSEAARQASEAEWSRIHGRLDQLLKLPAPVKRRQAGESTLPVPGHTRGFETPAEALTNDDTPEGFVPDPTRVYPNDPAGDIDQAPEVPVTSGAAGANKYARFAQPQQTANKYQKYLQPEAEAPLTYEQETAASDWANYAALIRKHHGDRSVQFAGSDLTIPDSPDAQWKLGIEAAKRSGWKSPPKAPVGDALITGTNDLTFGFSDEVGSGVQALASFLYNLPGRGVEGAAEKAGDTYGLRMDQMNTAMDKARGDRPLVTLAPTAAAVLAAPVLGGGKALVGRAAAPAATPPTFYSRFAKGATGAAKVAGAGAAAGELSGVGSGRGDLIERVKDAGWEAPAIGAGAGLLFAGAGRLAGSAVKGIDDAVRPVFLDAGKRELFLLERAMKRDGVSMSDLMQAQARVKRMGGDTLETLAELAAYTGKSKGKNLRGLARALHAIPGKAGEIADQLIEKRRAKIHSGASKAVKAGTGQKVADYADTLSDLEDQLRTNSNKAYDDFRAAQVRPDIYEQRIAPLLDTPPGALAMESARNALVVQAASLRGTNAGLADEIEKSAHSLWARMKDIEAAELRADGKIDEADAILEAANDMWASSGQQRGMLPPRALDEVKKAFDDQIETAGQRSYTGGNLRKLKNQFAEHVSAATDGAYGQALGTFSGGKRLREMIDTGYKSFNMKPHQLEQALEGTGGPGGMLTQEEFEGFTLGFARALQDALDSNDLSTVRKVLRDKGMQAKLRELMGSGFSGFLSRLQRLTNRQDFDNFVAGGSPTARIQQEVADATDEDMVTRVFENLASNPGSGIRSAIVASTIKPASRAAANFWRKLAHRGIGNADINERLGTRMFSPVTDSHMRQLSTDMATAPNSPVQNLPQRIQLPAAVAGASATGRDAVAMGSPEAKAEALVETYDASMIERYLDPSTTDQELMEIEAVFDPEDVGELRRLRGEMAASAGARQ